MDSSTFAYRLRSIPRWTIEDLWALWTRRLRRVKDAVGGFFAPTVSVASTGSIRSGSSRMDDCGGEAVFWHRPHRRAHTMFPLDGAQRVRITPRPVILMLAGLTPSVRASFDFASPMINGPSLAWPVLARSVAAGDRSRRW